VRGSGGKGGGYGEGGRGKQGGGAGNGKEGQGRGAQDGRGEVSGAGGEGSVEGEQGGVAGRGGGRGRQGEKGGANRGTEQAVPIHHAHTTPTPRPHHAHTTPTPHHTTPPTYKRGLQQGLGQAPALCLLSAPHNQLPQRGPQLRLRQAGAHQHLPTSHAATGRGHRPCRRGAKGQRHGGGVGERACRHVATSLK
jgi:hypothetical protein